jgi:hypothetical protein
MKSVALKGGFGLPPRPNERALRAANLKLESLPASKLIEIARSAGILTAAGHLTAYYRAASPPVRSLSRGRAAMKRVVAKK